MKNPKFRMTSLLIIAILVILWFFSNFDTNLFKNDIKYTFNEAVDRQKGKVSLILRKRWRICKCTR